MHLFLHNSGELNANPSDKVLYIVSFTFKFPNINNTLILSIDISGSENIGQIWICPIITFYFVVFFDHADQFVLLFILIIS